MMKRRLLLCCSALSLLGLTAVAGAEAALGRLFFTPERRQHLDHQRQMNIQTQVEIPQDPTLTINGVVMRSSGKRTIWVNGVAQNENDAPGDVSIAPLKTEPGRVAVQAGDTHTTQAKVGDTLNRNTGEATDQLGEGSITVLRTRQGK